MQRHWDALRRGPEALPHKQIVALAGQHYRELATVLEEEPSEPAIWAEVQRLSRDAGMSPEAMEAWYGASADALLEGEGLVVDGTTRSRLIAELHRSAVKLAMVQRRRAEGDYSADENLATFPEWTPQRELGQAPSGAGFTAARTYKLYDLWERED